MKVALFVVGLAAGIYGFAEAKTGHGLLFNGWLLLPPRSYLALIGSELCLLAGAFLVGRRRD